MEEAYLFSRDLLIFPDEPNQFGRWIRRFYVFEPARGCALCVFNSSSCTTRRLRERDRRKRRTRAGGKGKEM